jgi:hypothetical protein
MLGSLILMHSSKDPLHGVTLEALLNALVARYGWVEMARHFTRPRRPAEKFQAGLDAGIAFKAVNVDLAGHFHPAVARHQGIEQRFQRHAVQGLKAIPASSPA